MNYYDLVASIAGLGIPFESYHIEGYHPHETICIPSRGVKCCEILYFYKPEKVEINGFRMQKSYKKVTKENINDIFEIVLRTMNRNAL